MQEIFGCKSPSFDYGKGECTIGRRLDRSDLWDNPNLYLHNPEKLSNYVYGNHKDLGNLGRDSGDGWNYRGRGFIHLTGRYNYTHFEEWYNQKNGTKINFLEEPNLLYETRYGVESAFYFWESRNVNALAVDLSDKSFRLVSKAVNGGRVGLSARSIILNKLKKYEKKSE